MDTDLWQQELDEAKAAVRRRFPDLRCLRCSGENFYIKSYPDPERSFVTVSNRENDIFELVCTNCGFIEKHFAPNLISGEVKQDG